MSKRKFFALIALAYFTIYFLFTHASSLAAALWLGTMLGCVLEHDERDVLFSPTYGVDEDKSGDGAP